MATDSPVMDIGGASSSPFDQGLNLLVESATAGFPTDEDFALFDDNPEPLAYESTSQDSGSNPNNTTASPTDIWQPTEGEFSAARSATSTFMDTPALSHFSTPEDNAMSAQATPLFPSADDNGSYGHGVEFFDSQYGPNAEDLTAWTSGNGKTEPAVDTSPMIRQTTSNSASGSAPTLSPQYAGITKHRKRSRPVKNLNPDEGKTDADKKRIKNTLAARQSRARKVARSEGLESCAVAYHRHAYLLYQLCVDQGINVPPELVVPEKMVFPSAD